ncbi:MAG: hypothetical protein CSA35_07590 [Dethiosulfovibrio peptidovorans]|nr:MAG: hypothetical protein CSA35_07590 [Dethiosulfovibrio peptidovorans]
MENRSPFSSWNFFLQDNSVRWGAVLIPIVETEQGARIVMILRPQTMRAHGGQISFPGGGVEPQDRSPWDTACREAWEEVALHSASLLYLGALPLEDVWVSRFRVFPLVVQILTAVDIRDLHPNPSEVEQLILVEPRKLSSSPPIRAGEVRGVSYEYPEYSLEASLTIWGASARMIRNLDRLGYLRRFRLQSN